MKVSVSILKEYNRLINAVRKVNESKADFLHVDVMDGVFVDDVKFPLEVAKDVISYSKKKIDMHLMVNDLDTVIKYASLKPDYLTFHVEIIKDNGVTKFVTKGDNNNIKDSGYVEEDNIEGIYINKISGFGNVLLFMQKPSTLIVTLIIIAVGETIFILIDNSKLSLSDRKELEEYRRANKKEDK